ncbi:ParA family protein [Clostridium tyrobutyricum]|uniref:ParA family protein n=1 Tax=Clostridium tyrobutyricum TaxID=1519 RepID=UPI001C38BB90|nr:ParA family protein [Clostridium tyrobutyricum]MBV4424937.1 ParA family protein [Clostridium tyrobutyricum]
MSKYAFWNNKGGTGKTSLAFQAVTRYSEKYPDKKILAIDLCPQANLTELFLGGLMGNGSNHLNSLYINNPKRKSVGGYFQDRLPSPFTVPKINYNDYICMPNKFNTSINTNIDLLAGDPVVELQTNSIATLSNTQLPGTNTWIAVIDWINDFINLTNNKYDDVFIDTNPSFSIYTQIALASVEKLILPVMADDSSRRAIQNAFSLIHGVGLPSPIYNKYSFSSSMINANRVLPSVHLIVKNRLTQYMGPASAYNSVLVAINNDLRTLLQSNPNIFTFTNLNNGILEIRDFQTTGVVAFAEGKPFHKVSTGSHNILGKSTQISQQYINKCLKDIDNLVSLL